MSDSELSTPPVDSGSTAAGSFTDGVATSDDIAAVYASLEAPADADASSATAPDAAAPARATGTIDPPAAPVDDAVPSKGPIPFDRHESALKNAREKARADAEQEFRQRYSWADKHDPQQVEQASRLYQWLNTNPQGFHQFLTQQISAAQKTEEGPPEPDLKAEDGTPVYSGPQLRKLLEWERKQLTASVEQKYGPMAAKLAKQELEQTATTQASGIISEARTNWPLFADLEGDIKQRMVSNPALDLTSAYMASFREKGQALQFERWKTSHEGTLAQKSAASSSRPGAASTTPRNYRDMDVRDIAKEEFARLEGTTR